VAKKKCRSCGGTIHGKKCLICEMLATGAAPGGTQANGWPLQSEALACHQSQIAEHNERAKKHGINVEYKELPGHKTVVEIPDANERKKLMRLEGYHDKDSFL
jgi:hypothetical protein